MSTININGTPLQPAIDAAPEFRPPTGETLAAVIRDAARQVIEGYGPALRKLARS